MAGEVRGEYCKGICDLRGLGVLRDTVRACECLQKAVDSGYAPAAYQLGLLYKSGEEISSTNGKERHRKAVALIYTACVLDAQDSESDHLPPASLLGARRGGAVTCVTMRQMRRTCLKDALAASAHGGGGAPSLSAKSFGRCRVARIGVSEEDWVFDAEGEAAVRSSVEDADSAAVIPVFSAVDAALTLGRLLAEGAPLEGILPHPTAALAWYRFAIRGGSAAAMFEMGDVYRRGYGIPADPKRAFALFRAAASRGDGRGLFALGVCYEQGMGVESDPRRAFLNYEQAAQAGYVPAENNLGGCYEYGLGVVRDMTAATEWYARAAAAGLPEAACRLGLCYEYGRGVRSDIGKAIRLYESATEKGDPHAAYRLGLCYDRGACAEEYDRTH